MASTENLSLQERYAPGSICFGCGPSNLKGLRIQSRAPDWMAAKISEESPRVKAAWHCEAHHEAFPGMVNGGIIGALLDCHSNWTAAWHIMNLNHLDHPPCTVTASYSVKLLRPTPSDAELVLEAWVKVPESDAATALPGAASDRATILATLSANGKVCATCEGVFVMVKPGHPAYHRW